jgi:hypothetical protein
MSKLSAYEAITNVESNDLLVVVDVNDTTMAASGTTKRMTLAQLEVFSVGMQPSGDATGVTDTANLLTALAALPATGGTIWLAPGSFYITTGSVIITSQLNVSIRGTGRWATIIYGVGTGDVFRAYYNGSGGNGLICGGGFYDFTIDGTSCGAGSAGMHYGDRGAGEFRIAVQNFFTGTGDGSIGVHFDNQYGWTEENHGYFWLKNNTSQMVFDVSVPATTTVAAGSNGGEISAIASWGATYGGNGILDVGSTAVYSPTGTLTVAASGSTTAVITYTGKTTSTFTGCAYVSGSATGTVATGNTVTLVTSTNSFGYSNFEIESQIRIGQNGIVVQNGAQPYNSRISLKANCQGSSSAQTGLAVLTVTGQMAANHPNANYSGIATSELNIQAECGNTTGTNAPQTILWGSLTGANFIYGCEGILDFAMGLVAFTASNWTPEGSTGFSYWGPVRGDFNLNSATVGTENQYSFGNIGAPVVYAKGLVNVTNGHIQVSTADAFSVALTSNLVLSFNLGSGSATLGGAQRKTIILSQPSTGGTYNYTVTWPTAVSPTTTDCAVYWPGGTAPVMSTGAGATDVYSVVTYDGAHWYGEALQASSSTTGAISGQYLCAPSVYAPSASGAAVLLSVGSTTLAAFNVVATTVASGSNTGEISTIASWAFPSAGVLDVATTAGWPASGTVTVAASGPTTAIVTYTGISGGNSLTGCAYVSGSATGTVATGGAVTLTSVTLQTNSFIAPASGQVIVQVSATSDISTSGNKLSLALTAAGTVTPVLGYVNTLGLTSQGNVLPFQATFSVLVTPGSAYQLALVGATTSAGTAIIYAYGGTSTSLGIAGTPVIMTVQAV